MALIPRVTLKDLRNLNFSLFCKVFLKLRKFTNRITAVETRYVCLANPIICCSEDGSPGSLCHFLQYGS